MIQFQVGPAKVTAEVAATNGNAEVAIKSISLAGVPAAWLLRRRVNQTIQKSSPVPCRINERANLEFTLPVRITSLSADMSLAA